jgi:hypothetical protein
MSATHQRPKKTYMPTYDYSQVDNWSMSKEEANAIMNEASRLLEAGDREGFHREVKKIPLPPNMALSMRDEKGKNALLVEGWNLADAEIVFGKDWLDNYMVDEKTKIDE